MHQLATALARQAEARGKESHVMKEVEKSSEEITHRLMAPARDVPNKPMMGKRTAGLIASAVQHLFALGAIENQEDWLEVFSGRK